ncbi:MAG: hypothetical protein CBARDCOR_6682 [uncultured Caballeronia sp.]|nr:MAG: hypothetical protein CBARDCOR_6682 [uncultured Caballeronia sp.]
MGAISLARLPGRLIHTDGAAVAVNRDATDSPKHRPGGAWFPDCDRWHRSLDLTQ